MPTKPFSRRRLTSLFFLLTGSLTLVPTAFAAPPAPVASPLRSVNPFVGTAEHGHTYPGATVPFGMIQLSPDTRTEGWDGSSGYHYTDSTIQGFSHTHLSGTGVGDLGDLLLMPTVGDVYLEPGTPGKGYMSRFSHKQEKASPGYYQVFLQDPKVLVELSTTARCGFHKYTFPASDSAHIVLDLKHGIGNTPTDTSVTVENKTTLSGYRRVRGWAGDRAIYYVIEFSKPFESVELAKDDVRDGTATTAQGTNIKAVAQYKTTANEAISVKIGISGTSVEGARKNLKAEIPGWDFAAVRTGAEKQWTDALGAIKVETPDPRVRATFYTNLYQSLLAPVLYNDVDGTYRGMDKQNKTGATFQNYTTFSLWDTFRAQQPLLTLVQPQRVSDMVNALHNSYKEYGRHTTPIWPLWGNETWTMIGYHAAPVIAEAYAKGFRDYDAEAVYQAMRDTAMQNYNGLAEYRKSGYIYSSGGGQKQSVSRTLEYAYDDWCIAQMAQALGHKEDAQLFLSRAANYRNVFDTTTGFMRGRKEDGSWRRSFNPKQLVWADYTEANAWQYSWTVMQDVPGLINISGGDAPFIQKLDTLFTEKSDVLANIPDITGLIGQYAHGNEPVHHVAYLYNYAGAPYKTQQRIREVAALYDDTPAGQCGNNDCGQMSAWYVFSALGFYPVNPASGSYVIGSPLVEKAVLQLDKDHYKGKTFTVLAPNNSAKNLYIQSATLNGKPLNRSWISHNEIAAGGELKLVMGPKPNMAWGKAAASRPLSGMPTGFTYAALPAGSTNKYVPLPLPIRVAAGSDDPVAGFTPDPNMLDGQTNDARTKIDTSAPNAAPAEVYMSERYGSDFTHTFQVPKGKPYTVRLHFAEIFGDAPKERVENISINGKMVLKEFDIITEAGGPNKAVVKEFTAIEPDAQGNIKIRIQATPDSPDQNAKISAIEILP